MYIREQVISGALLTETRSTVYEDLTSKALLRCLVVVGRLQNEGEIKHNMLNELKEHYVIIG